MRIQQKEIESLGWVFNSITEGKTTYTLDLNLKDNKHNYVLVHTHKRDIINIFDASRKTSNEVLQGCNSVSDIKPLMKSLNIPYENN